MANKKGGNLGDMVEREKEETAIRESGAGLQNWGIT